MENDDIRAKVLKRQLKEDNDLFSKQSVSILGCGGLGSNISLMLARAGVRKLYIYDFDTIEYSNLNRQNYTMHEVGQHKVNATKARLNETLPYVEVEAFVQKVTPESLDEIVERSDLFIEAFDNRESKSMVLDYFMNHPNKYVITASGLSGLGDIRNIKIKHAGNVCLVGDFKSSPEEGLYLPYVSIIASLEALEALKWIKNGGNYGE